MFKPLVMAAMLLLSMPAMAYIGPGAGISVLGSLLGILVTIVVAIGAIVMWPLRKVLKKRRQASAAGDEPATPDDAGVESDPGTSGTASGTAPDTAPGDRG